MTNIEKLYELAEVKKVGKKYSCDALDFGACRTQNCDICDKAQDKNYPPFTEFKQLELIKWFGKNFDIIRYWINDSEYIVEINGIFGNNKDFSQALADLVCELWEDLTDSQREEVRGILR